MTPISPTLQATLHLLPDHGAETVLASSLREAWTYNCVSPAWHRFKIKLDEEGLIAPGLTPKDLRQTVATTSYEAELGERPIVDLPGERAPSMARYYSRSANIAEKNREAMATMEKENERYATIVKP
ncbi:hypothetical protein [uncultured Sulfitobacter sp.]|uniref:hypothetical protein n=1 Tax=uncultured Sulfitobacter sp. TaxID=191468 RepID=UPI00261AF6D6|nr:hypothetical protein [uncultured Sulfitobacter sp.]